MLPGMLRWSVMQPGWPRTGCAGVSLLLAGAACAQPSHPCTGLCEQQAECTTSDCPPLGARLSGDRTRRFVLRPTDLALVSSSHPAPRLPEAVVFGGRQEGAVALYARFEPLSEKAAPLRRAFLLLEPMPAAVPSTSAVEVQVWRVAEAWSADRLHWLRQPRVRLPVAKAMARTSPPTTLRIDVTELMRYFEQHPGHRHGIVLKAAAGDAYGAAYATGFGAGRGPSLEVYCPEQEASVRARKRSSAGQGSRTTRSRPAQDPPPHRTGAP